MPSPTPGQPAPDFRLPDAAGRTVQLKDFSGRWLVIYFYSKDDTPGWTAEAREFSDLRERFRALGTEVIGVSKDSPAAHARFAAKHGIGITLLADEDKAVMTAWGAWGEKTSYGKTTMGAIRSSYVVDGQGVVRAAWPRVAKAAGHAEVVLRRLEELAGA